MGSSMSIVNELEFPIHLSLCQVGPLHRVTNLQPGVHFTFENIGKVWFTVRVYSANDHNLHYVDEKAAALAIVGPILGGFALIPSASLIAGMASIGLATGKMIDDGVHGDNPSAYDLVSIFVGGASIGGNLATGVAKINQSVTNNLARTALKYIDQGVSNGFSVGDIAMACKESTGVLAEATSVYADGRTLYIRWDEDHSKILIVGA